MFEIDSGGHPSPGQQIRADRYYAAHLFGDLRDARAVPILIPLLKDKEINLIVPWALGEIGDKSAIPALIEMLSDNDLSMRAGATLALQKLKAEQEPHQRRPQLAEDEQLHSDGPIGASELASPANRHANRNYAIVPDLVGLPDISPNHKLRSLDRALKFG